MEEHNNIIIYQSEDGKTKIDVKWRMKRFGYCNSRWQSYFLLRGQMLLSISIIFMLKKNLIKIQPVVISDKFEKKVIEL